MAEASSSGLTDEEAAQRAMQEAVWRAALCTFITAGDVTSVREVLDDICAARGLSQPSVGQEESSYGLSDGAVYLFPENVNGGDTPLHWAAAAENTAICELLLDFRVSPIDVCNHGGESPLLTACRSRSFNCIRLLLASGASPLHVNAEGQSAVHLLCGSHLGRDGDLGLSASGYQPAERRRRRAPGSSAEFAFSALLGEIADRGDECSSSAVGSSKGGSGFLSRLDAHGRNAAHYAALTGSLRYLQLLIEADHDTMLIRSGEGDSVLHFAAAFVSGAEEAVCILSAAMAGVPREGDVVGDTDGKRLGDNNLLVILNAVNDAGETPLHAACRHANLPLARFLMQRGASARTKDVAGNSPLHHLLSGIVSAEDVKRQFSREGDAEGECGKKERSGGARRKADDEERLSLLDSLVARGANVAEANAHGATPLHLASRTGLITVFRQTVFALAATGSSRSSIAVAAGTSAQAEAGVPSLLPESGVQVAISADLVNKQDGDGMTPLHHACLVGSKDIVFELLCNSADPGLRTTDGRNCWDLAGEDDVKEDIVTMLSLESRVESLLREPKESLSRSTASYSRQPTLLLSQYNGTDLATIITRLDLSNCGFLAVPWELAYLVSLQSLDLSKNLLAGSALSLEQAPSLAYLNQLKALNISDNLLTHFPVFLSKKPLFAEGCVVARGNPWQFPSASLMDSADVAMDPVREALLGMEHGLCPAVHQRILVVGSDADARAALCRTLSDTGDCQPTQHYDEIGVSLTQCLISPPGTSLGAEAGKELLLCEADWSCLLDSGFDGVVLEGMTKSLVFLTVSLNDLMDEALEVGSCSPLVVDVCQWMMRVTSRLGGKVRFVLLGMVDLSRSHSFLSCMEDAENFLATVLKQVQTNLCGATAAPSTSDEERGAGLDVSTRESLDVLGDSGSLLVVAKTVVDTSADTHLPLRATLVGSSDSPVRDGPVVKLSSCARLLGVNHFPSLHGGILGDSSVPQNVEYCRKWVVDLLQPERPIARLTELEPIASIVGIDTSSHLACLVRHLVETGASLCCGLDPAVQSRGTHHHQVNVLDSSVYLVHPGWLHGVLCSLAAARSQCDSAGLASGGQLREQLASHLADASDADGTWKLLLKVLEGMGVLLHVQQAPRQADTLRSILKEFLGRSSEKPEEPSGQYAAGGEELYWVPGAADAVVDAQLTELLMQWRGGGSSGAGGSMGSFDPPSRRSTTAGRKRRLRTGSLGSPLDSEGEGAVKTQPTRCIDEELGGEALNGEAVEEKEKGEEEEAEAEREPLAEQHVGLFYCFGDASITPLPRSIVTTAIQLLCDRANGSVFSLDVTASVIRLWRNGCQVLLESSLSSRCGRYAPDRYLITLCEVEGALVHNSRSSGGYRVRSAPLSGATAPEHGILLLVDSLARTSSAPGLLAAIGAVLEDLFQAQPRTDKNRLSYQRRVTCTCFSCTNLHALPPMNFAASREDLHGHIYQDSVFLKADFCSLSGLAITSHGLFSFLRVGDDLLSPDRSGAEGALGLEANREKVRAMISLGIRQSVEAYDVLVEQITPKGSPRSRRGTPSSTPRSSPRPSSDSERDVEEAAKVIEEMMACTMTPSKSSSGCLVTAALPPRSTSALGLADRHSHPDSPSTDSHDSGRQTPKGQKFQSHSCHFSPGIHEHMYPDSVRHRQAGHAFLFESYEIVAFHDIRESNSLSNSQFLQDSLLDMESAGKSGSFFFRSRDGLCILKTVDEAELMFLLDISADLCQYVCETQPASLLCRFYGAYSLRQPGQEPIHFVVMENILAAGQKIRKVFDLKGSTKGRVASSPSDTILKDLDFQAGPGFLFGPVRERLFLTQLTNDCRFLEERDIMDYSLLVGVAGTKGKSALQRLSRHYSATPGTRLSLKPRSRPPSAGQVRGSQGLSPRGERHRGGLSLDMESSFVSAFRTEFGGLQGSDCESELLPVVFHMGIIDILQPYNFRKKVEHALKSITAVGDSLSCVDPTTYSARFVQFMRKNVTQVEPTHQRSEASGPSSPMAFYHVS